MTQAAPPPVETAYQKEKRRYDELFDRLVNSTLNWLFDLRPERAQRRARNLTLLFLLTGFLITIYYHPLGIWARYLQDIFLYVLNSAYAAGYQGDPFLNFTNFLITVATDARILQYLPIFVAPFFIAQQLAAYYLADIFELEDITAARLFISEVALTGSDDTIRISQGKIKEEDEHSPNYVIGGPGKVIVDLDSVALFERADGTPHVIGPTGKEPGGKATIDGFERFREAIDIRTHHVELRDQDPKSASVTSRSKDGMPISATDVRLMFSIDRGENPTPSAEFPYPFNKEAVERIVYSATARVTPEKQYPSEYTFNWINNMVGLIRGRLGGFMSERTLTEYLATIGQPEIERSRQREETIAEEVRQLTQPENGAEAKKAKAEPNFTPRSQITELFSKDFVGTARNRGVSLHWIGVGTWDLPPEIDKVSQEHLEAWKTAQENIREGTDEAMKKAEARAVLEKTKELIKEVPISTYKEIIGDKWNTNKKSGSFPYIKPDAGKHKAKVQEDDEGDEDDDDIYIGEDEIREAFDGLELDVEKLVELMNQRADSEADRRYKKTMSALNPKDGIRRLLVEYRRELAEAVQFIKAKNEPVPQVIGQAIVYIDRQLGLRDSDIAHWVGN